MRNKCGTKELVQIMLKKLQRFNLLKQVKFLRNFLNKISVILHSADLNKKPNIITGRNDNFYPISQLNLS